MSDPATSGKLALLLPTTPYTLAYTLPLLLLSTLLIFSGTFLTLDRTRSFPPRKGSDYSAVPGLFELKPKKRRFSWYLEGGVGGIAIGYAFGVHLSTFLALLIPVTTPSAPLTSKSFLAVWILCCIPTTILACRYRLAALLFSGIEGGSLIALGISVILHPSRLPRLILLAVFACLLTSLVMASAFIPRLSATLLHAVMRICTSATGAFGLVVSIALLLNPRVEGWANVWERLWLDHGEEWGMGKEKGLSAAWGIFWIVGIAADYALHRYIGECPDEKWDDYLTKYVADLPNQKDRAGTFQPVTGFWDRFFSRAPSKDYNLFNNPKRDIIFPSDKDMNMNLHSPFNVQPFTAPPLQRQSSIAKVKIPEDQGVPSAATFLKKSHSQKHKTKSTRRTKPSSRKPIKFGAIEELSSDSDDDVSPLPVYSPKVARPWVVTNQQPSYASSTPTLVAGRNNKSSEHNVPEVDVEKVDYDKDLAELKKLRGDKFQGDNTDYSDQEEDLGVQRRVSSIPQKPAEAWSPAFMLRHWGAADGATVLPPSTPGALPIPATPSLIKAVDRIHAAQREIYTPLAAHPESPLAFHDGFPHARVTTATAPAENLHLEDGKIDSDAVRLEETSSKRAPRWEEFWREVKVKAQS